MGQHRIRGGVCFYQGEWRAIVELDGVEYFGKTAHATEEAARKEYARTRDEIFKVINREVERGNILTVLNNMSVRN